MCLPDKNVKKAFYFLGCSYYCECLDGWTGVYCQEEVNECSSDPCQNNAECEDLNNGYKCHCPPSYTGELIKKFMYICKYFFKKIQFR